MQRRLLFFFRVRFRRFDFRGGSGVGQLLLPFLGVGFGEVAFDLERRAVDEFFGIGQIESGDFHHNLDHGDLIGACVARPSDGPRKHVHRELARGLLDVVCLAVLR